MTKRMLIDATHPEETRVVVLDGNRLEEFDVETSTKKQLKGNIYLAKVVRVEPSLQAAFVEYGGNRHGFLAFSEIHPDYYQIPVADRQKLIEMEEEEARREAEEEARRDEEAHRDEQRAAIGTAATAETLAAETFDESGANLDESDPYVIEPLPPAQSTGRARDESEESAAEVGAGRQPKPEEPPSLPAAEATEADEREEDETSRAAQPLIIGQDRVSGPIEAEFAMQDEVTGGESITGSEPPAAPAHESDQVAAGNDNETEQPLTFDESGAVTTEAEATDAFEESAPETPPPEIVGGYGDGAEEQRERRLPPRFLRNYKIQEVVRRRQILLVQVVKEERGTKGAALTTYLSLAGRFCVLMPNSPRGGGISRKITSPADRRRLKDIIAELDMPKGMGLIVRTAGANRPKAEIKRDCEYLLRLWDDIREHTLKSVAPALIYEEASLIKRAIRDVYSRDVDEILVDGEDGWRAAHEFMRMLMPSHAKKVQLWRDPAQPLFSRYQVESQLDAMLIPTVQLRSGGYLVINQAEALVAIDVNSGRSTRERNVEETALRTNLEAADEVARQLRLRDLAGLIVIDFIDMESKKHNGMVERRLKEALKSDRARIQVGHISHFGLLEMSRQRLRPSLAETSFIPCPHCGGTGHVRSVESAAIHVLRGIEEEGAKRRAAEIVVHVTTAVALYILNHKRERLREIETRYIMRVTILGDDAQVSPQFRIERVRAQTAQMETMPVRPESASSDVALVPDEAEDEDEAAGEEEDEPEEEDAGAAPQGDGAEAAGSEDSERRRRRRRRRRRGGRRDEAPPAAEPSITGMPPQGQSEGYGEDEAGPEPAGEVMHVEGVPETADVDDEDEDARGRRRGRRGGRRRRRGDEGELSPFATPGAEQPEVAPHYAGPTPANPFGGQAFDIFDVLEQAEARASAEFARSFPEEELPRSEPPREPEIENTGGPEPASAETAVAEGSAAEGAVVTQSEPEPEPESVVNETPPEPAIKPIVVGVDEVTAPKKRGWWRG